MTVLGKDSEDDVKTYINNDAINLGALEGPDSNFRLPLAGGGCVAFDFAQECDEYVDFSVVHDGTMLFILECFEYCLGKMVINDPSADYIVGKITRTEEFDVDGTKFAPKDKPWCKERTTYRIEYIIDVCNDEVI